MTFKHIKFEHSETMRSLEKLAKEKGLIRESIATKIASKRELDLTPSNSLMENIITLCSALREAGMSKYADDIQLKFLDYKAAKAKDCTLLDEAHPKGSYALIGVKGDAVIETVLDQHLAMLKIVEKQPTGKLSSASSSKDIINAAKFVLAQNTDDIKLTNRKAINEKIRNAKQLLIVKLQNIASEVGNWKDYTQDQLDDSWNTKCNIFMRSLIDAVENNNFEIGSIDTIFYNSSEVLDSRVKLALALVSKTPHLKIFSYKFPGWFAEINKATAEFSNTFNQLKLFTSGQIKSVDKATVGPKHVAIEEVTIEGDPQAINKKIREYSQLLPYIERAKRQVQAYYSKGQTVLMRGTDDQKLWAETEYMPFLRNLSNDLNQLSNIVSSISESGEDFSFSGVEIGTITSLDDFKQALNNVILPGLKQIG